MIAAVVCTLGTTERGRCDDVALWDVSVFLHVDAAYGGYFVFCRDSPLMSQIAVSSFDALPKADSVSIDPHKLGYAPYPIELFLLKNVHDTRYVNSTRKAYYIGSTSTSAFTIEGSRSGALAACADFGHTIATKTASQNSTT